MPNAETGQAQLPDVGALAYNGVAFSSLYKSNMSGEVMQDNAGRTVKVVAWTLTVEGIVTLQNNQSTTDAQWAILRRNLDEDGGQLTYKSKGFGRLVVNQLGSKIQDCNWGPKPKTLYFQPLGGSRAALITWQVTTWIFEGDIDGNLLQFNEETSVSYDDEQYSSVSMRGTMEIPLSRRTQNNRACPVTVDDFRARFLDIVRQVDLLRFRVTRRNFNVSRDKRTMEWEIMLEEHTPFGIPAGMTNARGTMSVKPLDVGPGMCTWLCSLKGTYVVAKNLPRRTAWWAFISLLKFRMGFAANGLIPKIADKGKDAQQPPAFKINKTVGKFIGAHLALGGGAGFLANGFFQQQLKAQEAQPKLNAQAIIQSFSFDEGLYLDGKTITFEASWVCFTMLEGILVSTGVWQKSNVDGVSDWSVAMRDIQGWRSWLFNRVDAQSDIIVDLGVDSAAPGLPQNLLP